MDTKLNTFPLNVKTLFSSLLTMGLTIKKINMKTKQTNLHVVLLYSLLGIILLTSIFLA